MHRFFFWWSAIFGPLCLIWAAWMATGMHWLFAGIGAGATAGHGWALKLHHDRIPPRIPPPSRHDLALLEIDRLERELRVGAHAKTQAEFDREVEAAVRFPPVHVRPDDSPAGAPRYTIPPPHAIPDDVWAAWRAQLRERKAGPTVGGSVVWPGNRANDPGDDGR